MARSLLTKVVSSFWKRPAVVRVTSDPSTSTSYQAAPQKTARFDPSQAFDSFGSLVNSNVQPEPPAALTQPTPQRSANRSSATSDSSSGREAAPDRSAAGDRTDRSGQTGRSDPSTSAGPTSSDTKADAATHHDGKSGDGTSNDGKAGKTTETGASAKDSSSGDAAATDSAGVAQSSVSALTLTDPTAIAIPPTIAPALAPDIAQRPDGAPKPLAIAAAALATAAVTAAGSPATAVPEISTAPGNTESDAGFTPITGAKTSAQATTIAATVKAAAAAPGAVTEPTAATDTTDVALAAAISGPQTIDGKSAAAKGGPSGQVKTQTASEASTSPDPTTTATTTEAGLNGAAPQPAAGAKSDTAPAAAGAARPEVSNATAATTGAVSSRDHGSNRNAATSPANADTSLQFPTSFQPQAPTTPLTLSTANLTAAAAAAGAPVPLSGLAVEIAAAAHSGKTRFDVRLDPADLGRIDVRIDVDRNGQVTSHLRVEKPETLSMLQQDAPQLRQALDDAGLKTGNGGLQFSLRDQSSSGQNNDKQTGGNAQRLVISEDDSVPVAVAGRSYGRMLGSNGGVDIRV